MSDDKQERRLICAPVDGGSHTADSIQRDGDCGHRVWVAGAGQRAIAEHPDIEVQCIVCALPSIIGSDAEVKPADGALDDLANEFGEGDRKGAEVVLALMTALAQGRKRSH